MADKYSSEAEDLAIVKLRESATAKPLMKRFAIYANGDWNGSVCRHVANSAKIHGLIVNTRRGYDDAVHVASNDGYENLICDIAPESTFDNDDARYVLISNNLSVIRKYEDVNADNLVKVFDPTVSSALLLYRYLAALGYFEGRVLPRSVKYFDDITTKNYALPESRALEAWASANTISKTLPELDAMTDVEFARCVDRGNAIIMYRDGLVRSACGDHVTRGLKVGGVKLSLCVVVSTSFVDEISSRLLTAENTPPNRVIAICRYSVRKNKWLVSMRSDCDEFDVGRYCETRGGGGNRYSGGFTYAGNLDNLFDEERKIMRDRAREYDLDIDLDVEDV